MGVVAIAAPLGAQASVPVLPLQQFVTPSAQAAGRWLVHVPSGSSNVASSISVDSVTGKVGYTAAQDLPQQPDGSIGEELIIGEMTGSTGVGAWRVVIPEAYGSVLAEPGGDLVVSGQFRETSSLSSHLSGPANSCFTARYQTLDQEISWGWVIPTASCQASARDTVGDVYLAGHYSGGSLFGQPADGTGVYIARLNGLTGQPVWIDQVQDNSAIIDGIALGGDGQVFVAGRYGTRQEPLIFSSTVALPAARQVPGSDLVAYPWLAAFDAITATPQWVRGLVVSGNPAGGYVHALAATSKAVAISFSCCLYDLGGGAVGPEQPMTGGLVAAYSPATGTYLWSESLGTLDSYAQPPLLTTDPAGHLVFADRLPAGLVIDLPGDNYSGTEVQSPQQSGGTVLTGLIDATTGSVHDLTRTGGDNDSWDGPATAISSVAVDSSGHIYTAGRFEVATWQYGHYLYGSSNSNVLYGYATG
jgi:hypothetical protein